MELEEARDILANCINDYVIAEYCSSCDDKESCKDDDCIFSKAINVVLNHITKQEKMIELMLDWIDNNNLYEDEHGNNCLIEGDSCYEWKYGNKNCKECIKQYFEKKVEENK